MYVCSALVGLDNKLYKMHATYIKIVEAIVEVFKVRAIFSGVAF